MEIQHHLHEHPLTLCENDDGRLRCHCCGNRRFGKSYRCNKCKFVPKGCFACTERPAGSFYICKECWPNSPIFHRSCAELPQNVQITYRPHCALHFEQNSSRSPHVNCDFCGTKHTEHNKFCCDLCSFEIYYRCVATLMKFHEGRESIEHFSHRHPLALLELKVGADRYCRLCGDYLHGLIYACMPCEFYIHKSCGGLQQEIRHPFHQRHHLTLQVGELPKYQCHACCFSFRGFRYRCEECKFDLHPECKSLTPNIKYEGHQHLLIIVENMSYKSKCQACGFKIQGVFFMRCLECRLNFHVQCGPLPLPQTVVHKQHKHSLVLSTERYINHYSDLTNCDACEKERNPEHPFYYCVECDYVAHVRCAVTEVQFNNKLIHFSHSHALILHENLSNFCNGCGKSIKSTAYACNPCRFYLHKSCAELPRDIYLPSHQHYLTLKSSYVSTEAICGICGNHFNGFTYQCKTCFFDLDLGCASTPPSINLIAYDDDCKYLEGKGKIGHFSHQHPLTILEVGDINCGLCSKNIHGKSYGCIPCKFYIHDSCSELSKDIIHPFHPPHSLELRKPIDQCVCVACGFHIEGLRYRCDGCDVDFHPKCTSLKPNIKHKDHGHLLLLIENMSYESKCEACGCKIEGVFFLRCVECSLDFHVQCGPLSLPSTVVHKQHEHPLTLLKDQFNKTYCDVCKKESNPKHPVYNCDECEYCAHVRCVITEVQLDEREKLKHFSHEHFLFLLDYKNRDDIICYACEEDVKVEPAYGCYPCKLHLHKSCAELPRKKPHPFHRHPLSLPEPYVRKHTKCNGCHKYCTGFTYSCIDCDFHLDLDCSLLYPSIKYQGHQHILTFFKKLYNNPECTGCRLTTPDKLTPLDDFYFRCVTCNLNAHLMCSSVPQTIEHDSHQHPISFRVNFVDLGFGCDDGYYCCDVCEARRDARECVYYCEECSFVVDIDCVFSEVMDSLEGKRGEVKMTSVSRFTTHELIKKTYNDILGSFTKEEDEKTIKSIVLDIHEEFKQFYQEHADSSDEIIVIITKQFSIWDEDSLLKMARGYAEGVVYLKELTKKNIEDEEVVDAGDNYTITSNFAPLLRNLLDKHGDFGANCPLNKRLKTITLVTLCAIVQEMKYTKVADMDYNSIVYWCYYLKLIQRAGFRVDFVSTHLQKILRAYSETDREVPKNGLLYDLHEQIAQHSQEIDEREAKIEMLRKGIRDIISGYGSERSRVEVKRYSETLEFAWQNVTTGLL